MVLGDYMILAILAVWLIAVIVFMIRKKKRGGGIGCSCESCAGCDKKKK